MASVPKMDVAEFALAIEKMADEELFELMAALEEASEAEGGETDTDVVARMALVETEIESRFPGQLLTPFKRWKESRVTE
jgi:hypothetical protein